jgi:hypothetical protein
LSTDIVEAYIEIFVGPLIVELTVKASALFSYTKYSRVKKRVKEVQQSKEKKQRKHSGPKTK